MAERLELDAGVLVTAVKPGSAAERAGLQRGDVIVAMDGARVEDLGDVRRALGEAVTFFFRHMYPLITHGHLYIAQPPLFKITSGKKEQYAYTEARGRPSSRT